MGAWAVAPPPPTHTEAACVCRQRCLAGPAREAPQQPGSCALPTRAQEGGGGLFGGGMGNLMENLKKAQASRDAVET